MCTARLAAAVLCGWIGGAAAQGQDAGPLSETGTRLAAIKSVCVDKIAGEEGVVGAARELAIAGLFAAKRFTVLEHCEKADASLKGAVLERGEKKVRGEGEAAEFGAAGGGGSVNRNGGSGGFGAIAGGSGESLYSAETGSSATVVLRLVDREGVVVWAFSQDSSGGKLKGAVSDAVDRAVRQLVKDLERSSHKP